MDYEIKLQEFEGPLDLLLHLVQKHEIDIFDIPISEITEQYIYYINQFKEYNMELSSEFIVMAAHLIQLKSKLLLPIEENENGEEIDPRDELAQRIYDYKIFKEISGFIKSKEDTYLKIFYKDPEYQLINDDIITNIDINSLLEAFKKVIAKSKIEAKDEEIIIHKIQSETIRIEDKIKQIITQLDNNETVEFSSLFPHRPTRTNIVVTFLALLELLKKNVIKFIQYKTCGEIIISKV
ncbi:hypothetical protein GC105_05260 [Alkalibaculum sp. M08DMB]|uniref:Segregation and condensation protein A n=1 Tax=Alkalibaculum sporogenes TaxID=2655001 RepID=A0A6A7K6V7_9FIRM|nr:segregation/condensation protein A [Alkalibaculum sporogenes]MPW25198.1 hypothetical protein [Alkalibaculum sporogenes]